MKIKRISKSYSYVIDKFSVTKPFIDSQILHLFIQILFRKKKNN